MTASTEQLEANKKLARDYIDQVFNQHNPSKAADFVTGDVVWHGNSLGDNATIMVRLGVFSPPWAA